MKDPKYLIIYEEKPPPEPDPPEKPGEPGDG